MATVSFRPLNLGRWLIWGAGAVLLAVLPLAFTESAVVSLMSQMCTFIIFALAYNMLLGQGGMLSFGHAVYSGLGAYFAVHALNMIGKGSLALPVALLPLVGGLAGLLFGLLFGYVTTRRSGTTFAMISLGIGEMVFACSLMFPGFFGGEGGVSTNRVVGQPFLGITFGPGIQVYYLIAVWMLICMAAMFAWTQTPLGRMANAVRDNPERAEFIGYDPQMVRFLTLVLSSFFAGVSGGLATINFELVTAENVSAVRSGGVLFATFIGGIGFFFGPIIGGIIFIYFVVSISLYTKAWLLYLGLFFVSMVLFAPGGIASLIAMHVPVARARLLRLLLAPYAGAAAAGAVLLAGIIAVVEMTYHFSLERKVNPQTSLAGVVFDVTSPQAWLTALALLAVGALCFAFAWRSVRRAWNDIALKLQETAA
jgi:branched-chain amino acid transport system permease protein